MNIKNSSTGQLLLSTLVKVGLFVLSIILNLAVSLVVINITLNITRMGRSPVFTEWTLDTTTYSPRYVYWGKNHCELSPQECSKPEGEYLTHAPEVFAQENNSAPCKTVLFLGDSFTLAPWTNKGESYAAVFSQRLALENKICVRMYRVATGGVGNDQEFARFTDVVKTIRPQIVFWQFYENDLFENVTAELYVFRGNELYRKNAYFNTSFIAGFLNQRIPLLRDTTTGRHIMFLGEFADVFRVWPVNPYNEEEIISYNRRKVPALLTLMSDLAKSHQFVFYTTLAPLECEVDQKFHCPWSSRRTQQTLREMLQKSGRYISMDGSLLKKLTVLGATTSKEDERLFDTVHDRNPPGARHLSPEGNKRYGTLLYENYRFQEKL